MEILTGVGAKNREEIDIFLRRGDEVELLGKILTLVKNCFKGGST